MKVNERISICEIRKPSGEVEFEWSFSGEPGMIGLWSKSEVEAVCEVQTTTKRVLVRDRAIEDSTLLGRRLVMADGSTRTCRHYVASLPTVVESEVLQ